RPSSTRDRMWARHLSRDTLEGVPVLSVEDVAGEEPLRIDTPPVDVGRGSGSEASASARDLACGSDGRDAWSASAVSGREPRELCPRGDVPGQWTVVKRRLAARSSS